MTPSPDPDAGMGPAGAGRHANCGTPAPGCACCAPEGGGATDRLPHKAAAAILALSLAVRLVYALAVCARPYPDIDGYEALALSLRERGTYATESGTLTAYRPCLYPLFLAGLYGVTGVSHVAVGVAQSLMGLAVTWLTLLTGTRLFGRRGGLIAAAVAAASPLLIHSTGLLMTEMLFALICTGLVALLAWGGRGAGRRLGAALGFLGGLGALCRPTMLLCFPPLLVTVVLVSAGPMRARLRLAAASVAVLVAVLAPWTVRNWRAFGVPIVTTTHGGYTLLLGNNPRFYHWVAVSDETGGLWPEGDLRAWQRGLWERTAGQGEVERDRSFYREAFEFIRENPVVFLRLTLIKACRFWRLAPHEMYSRPVRLATGVFYGAVYLLAVVGLVRMRRRLAVVAPWVVLAAVLAAAHAVYWANVRMRAPLEPILALLVAAALGPASSPHGPRKGLTSRLTAP